MAAHLFSEWLQTFGACIVEYVAMKFQWCMQCNTLKMVAVDKSKKNRRPKMRQKNSQILFQVHTVDWRGKWESEIEKKNAINCMFAMCNLCKYRGEHILDSCWDIQLQIIRISNWIFSWLSKPLWINWLSNYGNYSMCIAPVQLQHQFEHTFSVPKWNWTYQICGWFGFGHSKMRLLLLNCMHHIQFYGCKRFRWPALLNQILGYGHNTHADASISFWLVVLT